MIIYVDQGFCIAVNLITGQLASPADWLIRLGAGNMITTSRRDRALEMMVFIGKAFPFMAARFRLGNYGDLPRFFEATDFEAILWPSMLHFGLENVESIYSRIWFWPRLSTFQSFHLERISIRWWNQSLRSRIRFPWYFHGVIHSRDGGVPWEIPMDSLIHSSKTRLAPRMIGWRSPNS